MRSSRDSKSPRLSVIIVSYRCLDVLSECLDSLNASGESLQIIVIDNASGDGTVEALRQLYPGVVLIENFQNAGFPAANNQGLGVAESRNILLLNPDTVVVSGALQTLIQFLESSDEPKIVGPTVTNFDGSPQHTVHHTIPGALRFVGEQVGLLEIPSVKVASDSEEPTHSGAYLVGWVSGAALAFTRNVIELIGELDEDLFWAEDLDFCYRANKAGVPIYHLPGASIKHHVGQSGKKNYRRMVLARHSSRVDFAKKHYGRLSELGLRTAFSLLIPFKMAIRFAQLPLRARRVENQQRLAGYWDALRFCLPRFQRNGSD